MSETSPRFVVLERSAKFGGGWDVRTQGGLGAEGLTADEALWTVALILMGKPAHYLQSPSERRDWLHRMGLDSCVLLRSERAVRGDS